ncbi:MAG: MJ0042-type zinc finger domain-containing protein, partial [Marinobacter sp.]
MTQSSLQTQCPECATRFRVTDEQLSVAGGKVRCGNCMAIFNAKEHRIAPSGDSTTSSSQRAPESPSSDAPPQTETRSSVIEDDFVFVDNPEEDAEEGLYAGDKLTFSEDELSDSFLSVDDRNHDGFAESDPTHSHSQVDESWAEAMLSGDPAEAPKPSTQKPE